MYNCKNISEKKCNQILNDECSNDNCTNNKYFETACNDINSNNHFNCNCSCGFDENDSVFPQNPMLGQSYVPFQQINKTFIPEVGLKMGTIFPELVNPYKPFQSVEENEYIKCKNTIGEGCNR